jgi:hypothetical protein
MSITEEELLLLKRAPVHVCLHINIGVTVCAKTGIFSITCKPISFEMQHKFYVEFLVICTAPLLGLSHLTEVGSKSINVGFGVLTAMVAKSFVFWDNAMQFVEFSQRL